MCVAVGWCTWSLNIVETSMCTCMRVCAFKPAKDIMNHDSGS